MNKKIRTYALSALTMMISGCFTFAPTEGMSIKQVNDDAYVPCYGSRKIKDEHLVFVGNHPENPKIQIYNTAAHVKYKRASPECQKTLYFYDEKLIGEERVAALIKEHQIYLAEKNAEREVMLQKRAESIKIIQDFISVNKLTVLDDFKYKSFNEFRIYVDPNSKRFYSIYYQFVSESEVSRQIAEYRAIEQRKMFAQQQEQKRQDELRRKEGERMAEIRRQKAEKERCLGGGTVGVCQSWATNTSTNICGTRLGGAFGAFEGLANAFNPDCYMTDKWNIQVNLETRNNLSRNVADVRITCSQIARSGTVLDQVSKTIFDIWTPREIKEVSFKFRKHEQVAGVSCSATSWR